MKQYSMTRYAAAALGVWVVVVAAGCSSTDPRDDVVTVTPAPPAGITARASSAYNIVVSWPACTGDDQQDVEMAIERSPAGFEDYRPVARRPARYGRFLDLSLTPQTGYVYRIRACRVDDCSEYVTGGDVATMESLLPEIEITVPYEGPDTDEIIMMNAQDWLDPTETYSALLAMKRDGTIVWSLQDVAGGDIKEYQPLDDHTVAAITGTTIAVLDLDGGELYRYTGDMSHHDIDPTADGKFIYLYWEQIMDDNDMPLLADGIRILDPLTSTVTWEWRIENHVPFSDYCEDCIGNVWKDIGHDWTHSNSVYFDEAKGYMYLNVRNLNRIYKIKYPSGDVDMILGDGGDFGGGIWSHCHAPLYFEDGRILMFDNGLHRQDGTNWSRTIIVDYDEEAKTAEMTWEYREDPDFFALGFGNASFTSGGILTCDGGNFRVVETTMEGEKIWEMKFKGFYTQYIATVLNPGFFEDWGAAPRDYGWQPENKK